MISAKMILSCIKIIKALTTNNEVQSSGIGPFEQVFYL